MYFILITALAIGSTAIIVVLVLLLRRNDRKKEKYTTTCDICGSRNLQLSKVQEGGNGMSRRNIDYSEYICMDCGNTVTETI